MLFRSSSSCLSSRLAFLFGCWRGWQCLPLSSLPNSSYRSTCQPPSLAAYKPALRAISSLPPTTIFSPHLHARRLLPPNSSSDTQLFSHTTWVDGYSTQRALPIVQGPGGIDIPLDELLKSMTSSGADTAARSRAHAKSANNSSAILTRRSSSPPVRPAQVRPTL